MRHTFLTLIVIASAAAFAPRPSHAAEPVPEPLPRAPTAAEAADKLHELAKADYLEGKKEQAIEYWREAHRLDPTWKYAYNLSNALYEIGDLIASWDFIRESERLGLPPRYLDKLGELRTKIQLDLLKTHAYIQLQTEPADVVVTLDGEPFAPPFARWIAADTSHVVVSREGYLTHEQELVHAPGQRYTFDIRLERAPAVLVVTGTPAHARVRVDGNVIGTLPEAGPSLLAQGKHDVHASARGYRAQVQQIEVKAGQKAHVTFELVPVDRGVSLDTLGWIAGGVGVASLVAGTILLVGAKDTADGIDALNADASALAATSYEAYRAHYASEKSKYDDQRTYGYVCVGVGVAAVIAATTLILFPEDEDGEAAEPGTSPAPAKGPTPTPVGVTPLPGGVALFGGFEF